MGSEAKKDRVGKVEPTLANPSFINGMARVRMFGNNKYPDKDNWQVFKGTEYLNDQEKQHVQVGIDLLVGKKETSL